MSDVPYNAASQFIAEYVKSILDETEQGKKLSNREYLTICVI